MKLTTKFRGKLDREYEDLDFLYGSNIMFRIYTQRLNRGGTGLRFIDYPTNEILISVGRCHNFKNFLKKAVKIMQDRHFDINIDDINKDIKNYRKLVVNNLITETNEELRIINLAIKQHEASLKVRRTQKKELNHKLIILQNIKSKDNEDF